MTEREKIEHENTPYETAILALESRVNSAIQASFTTTPSFRTYDEENAKIIWSDAPGRGFMLHTWSAWDGSGWEQKIATFGKGGEKELSLKGAQYTLPSSFYAYKRTAEVKELGADGTQIKRQATELDLEEASFICEIIESDILQTARKETRSRALAQQAERLERAYLTTSNIDISEVDYFKS